MGTRIMLASSDIKAQFGHILIYNTFKASFFIKHAVKLSLVNWIDTFFLARSISEGSSSVSPQESPPAAIEILLSVPSCSETSSDEKLVKWDLFKSTWESTHIFRNCRWYTLIYLRLQHFLKMLWILNRRQWKTMPHHGISSERPDELKMQTSLITGQQVNRQNMFINVWCGDSTHIQFHYSQHPI